MIGVFILSALVGGGVAGLFLAMQQSVSPLQDDPAGSTSISIVAPRPSPAASTPVSTPASTPVPASSAAANGKGQDRIAATAPAAPATPDNAPAVQGSSTPGAQELQQLTEQVVSALGALDRAEQQGTVEEAAAGTERLRDSLAQLVNAALAKGKTNEEIRKLVAEAFNNAGDVPALLRDASGKVDVQRLLASILPTMQAAAVPMTPDERDYFNQLTAEANTTTTDEPSGAGAAAGKPASRRPAAGKAEKAARGRFFVRNGKRYTIIRKGDTLSDIAYAAYGDVLAYPAILRANGGRISPRALKPGTRILIPDIATTRKTRKGKTRRQGALRDKTVPRRSLAAGNASRVTLQPTSAIPVTRLKVTNFNTARQRQPIPLTDGGMMQPATSP